ncbi:hypothetical protein ANANG_G00309500 [Anguilla anguilla]|uniref:Uncharacterized protein n=1 Tax=Anguilla anguilla TaxID=7936 RepID=A0A9D3LI18_ANGAN|nr:hypothetical protein ANANG_G00309500 [Anguilla anguilla]
MGVFRRARGGRGSAAATSGMLNQLDVQRAAIVLGYRACAAGAARGEAGRPPPRPRATTCGSSWAWSPVLVVVIIIIILYWKMCRTDKLEFQPDAMAHCSAEAEGPRYEPPLLSARTERNADYIRLQAPSVKGFDFAKLHLGQHSKDDIMVIQEPAPLPAPDKE